jgi:shikimate kinase
LAAQDPLVVATGGGTLTNPANRDLIRRLGVTVWLHPDFALLARRIGGLGKRDRPLFRDETQALSLYRERLELYRQADRILEIDANESPEEVAARIELLLPQRACAL